MPGTQDSSLSAKPPLASKLTSDSEYQGLQLLAESYTLSLRYGQEYMDDNPLLGEPGSFILSKSAVPNVAPAAPKAPALNKRPPAPEIKTANLTAPVRKGSKGAEKSPVSPVTKDRKARRKSKAANGNASVEAGSAAAPAGK